MDCRESGTSAPGKGSCSGDSAYQGGTGKQNSGTTDQSSNNWFDRCDPEYKSNYYKSNKKFENGINSLAMMKNYFKIAWRSLLKDRQFTLLNVLGLSAGLACSLLIFVWVSDELNIVNCIPGIMVDDE